MKLTGQKDSISTCSMVKALQPVCERGLDVDTILAATGIPARLLSLALPSTPQQTNDRGRSKID
jgi:hypothetical protein